MMVLEVRDRMRHVVLAALEIAFPQRFSIAEDARKTAHGRRQIADQELRSEL